MLYPKQTNCTECGNIQSLLNDIDCKLAQLSNTLYNNIVFMLNKSISGVTMFDLLFYKRILEYKQINPNYACNYSVNMIASKVKLIASNCVRNCFEAPVMRTTTTTSSSSTTSTTSSTTSSSTTTTTVTTQPASPLIEDGSLTYGAQNGIGNGCDGLLYPYTIDFTSPYPEAFTFLFTPVQMWSAIEYI